MDDVRLIVGTAVTVGGAIAGLAGWAFRSVVAREVTPVIIELRAEAKALTREFALYRQDKDAERTETRRILNDLDKIVHDHETRITVLESPPPAARKRRAA